MKNSRHFAFSFFTVIMITCLVWVGPAAAKEKTKHTDNLLNALAQELGTGVESLEVLHEAVFSLPNIEGKYPTAKVRDTKTGNVHGITIDDKGRKVDKEAFLEEDLKKEKEKYGKLERALFNKLEKLNDDTEIDVDLWLDVPDEPLVMPTVEDFKNKGEFLIEMQMQTQEKEKRAKIKSYHEPVMKHLKNLNITIANADEFMPVVTASLNKKQIRDIANRQDIVRIYPSSVPSQNLDVSVPTVFHSASGWPSGFTGLNQLVAINEKSKIRFANPTNSYLRGSNKPDSCFVANDDHSMNVAGVVASTHPTYTGVAYNAKVYGAAHCRTDDDNSTVGDFTDIRKATQAAYDAGARVHNHSWNYKDRSYAPQGKLEAQAIYEDGFIRDYGVTIVHSAGNCEPDCYVNSPAIGYNVIAVGAFYDWDTVPWIDYDANGNIIGQDSSVYYSSYINPKSANGDREKPEVAAPGLYITTLTVTKNPDGTLIHKPTTVGGTSVAAPHVSAGAALLMERDSTLTNTLKYWPMAVKAILMATATNNVDNLEVLPYPSDSKDGAGGINLGAAYLVASDTGKWKVKTVTSSSFTSGYAMNLFKFSCSQGQRIRAVIAWDTPISYSNYPSQPGADLDLSVWNSDSDGRISYGYGSATMDNTYEIVDFTAEITGTCYVNVNKYRFNQDSAHLAAAWYAY